ncbi:hypothetical protein [Streptomyces sp. NPDC004284]|uniref:hypothetical protein n=1 Tax=Streptomyces sp. NPDC004284 TaxID=3364695 RepID=UPI00369BF6DD
MRYGEGYIRLVGQEHGPDGGRGHHPWREALPATGLSEEAVRAARDTHLPERLAAEVARTFGEPFAEEPWTHCLLLGRQAAHGARLLGPPPDAMPPAPSTGCGTPPSPPRTPPDSRPSAAPRRARPRSAR